MKGTVLITGASSGFGYEFAKLFAEDNYNLILVARNTERLYEIKQRFPYVNVKVIKKDLIKPDAVKELFQEIREEAWTVDMLVNNAGFGLMGNFYELELEKQINMLQLNVSVLTELTHYALQEMKGKNHGRILNVASTAAFQPGPLMAVYFASKAYVLSFSEALAEELRGTGITVTVLCPGPSKTNFAAVANAEETKLFKRGMKAELVARIGYNAMMRGQRVVITGTINKLGTYAAKFLPRSTVARLVKRISTQK